MEITQITPSLRVTVDYLDDPYYTDIERHISDIGLAIHSIRQARGIGSYKTDTSYTESLDKTIDDQTGGFNWQVEPSEAIKSYLSSYEMPFVIAELKGFSQGEWSEVVIYDVNYVWTVEQLKGVVEDIIPMYQGEVYEVRVEKAKVFYANDGDTITQWVTDENYEQLVEVESLFTLTPEFIKQSYNLEVVPEVEG